VTSGFDIYAYFMFWSNLSPTIFFTKESEFLPLVASLCILRSIEFVFCFIILEYFWIQARNNSDWFSLYAYSVHQLYQFDQLRQEFNFFILTIHIDVNIRLLLGIQSLINLHLPLANLVFSIVAKTMSKIYLKGGFFSKS